VKPVIVVMVVKPTLFYVQLEDTARVVTIFLAVQKEPTVVVQEQKPKILLARIVHQEDFNPWKHKFHAIKHVHWASMVLLKGK
jgi:hypothetical protein